jgi:hypothetical protein
VLPAFPLGGFAAGLSCLLSKLSGLLDPKGRLEALPYSTGCIDLAPTNCYKHSDQDMPATVTIHDETSSGQKTHTFTLDCLTERMTVRDLIRARIYQEVHDYNSRQPEYFRGLVEPTEAELTLNGYKLRTRKKIDWEKQFEGALQAFERNGFFVLVGDKQAAKLDEEFAVKTDTEVSFVKLVPLVGG